MRNSNLHHIGVTDYLKIYTTASILLLLSLISPLHTAFAQSNTSNGFNLDLSAQDHRSGQYFVDPLLTILQQRSSPPEAFLKLTTYRLRPGDLLTIQLHEPQRFSGRGLSINSSGDIWLPKIGPISIAGLTVAKAQEKITDAFTSQFRDPKISLTVDQIRPFKVHTSIPNRKSGSFTIPAGIRLSELIEQSNKGHSASRDSGNTHLDIAHMNKAGLNARRIRLTHADGSSAIIDMAPYLTNRVRNSSTDPFLLPGDQISIEPLIKETDFIGISGAVLRPIELPYQHGDQLQDLIEFAGGMLDVAQTDSIRLITSSEHSIHIVASSDAPNTALQPNTRVVIPYNHTKRSLSAARVEIAGEIHYPGTYPIKEGETTLREILTSAGGITPDALPHAAYVQREQRSLPNDPLTEGMDTIDPRTLKRASDQLKQGFDYLNLEAAMDQNRTYVDLSNDKNLESTTLSNGDRIVIPRDYGTVYVFGQVNRPGYQPYETGKSIQNYIDQANGITIAADPERIFVIEAGTKAWIPYTEANVQSGDLIFVDRVPLDELNAKRNYEVQLKNLRRSNLQLILTTISTVTAVITTYVALFK